MHQRSDRHATHPWPLARQRPQQRDLPLGAKAPSSSARQALEAAFVESQTPPSDPRSTASNVEARTGSITPALVIKRKRTFAAPDAADASVTEPVHLDAGGEGNRAPRVFRVVSAPVPISTPAPKSTAAASAAAAMPSDGTGPTGDNSGVDVGLHPVPVTAARRPRRRAAPVIVTTIVPGRQEAAVGSATNPARTDRADELLERLAALEATLSLIRDAREFRLLMRRGVSGKRRDPGSYLALTAEVKRLQRVAQAAREAEASQAISWIKRVIETYALTRDDLGI